MAVASTILDRSTRTSTCKVVVITYELPCCRAGSRPEVMGGDHHLACARKQFCLIDYRLLRRSFDRPYSGADRRFSIARIAPLSKRCVCTPDLLKRLAEAQLSKDRTGQGGIITAPKIENPSRNQRRFYCPPPEPKIFRSTRRANHL